MLAENDQQYVVLSKIALNVFRGICVCARTWFDAFRKQVFSKLVILEFKIPMNAKQVIIHTEHLYRL